jgi:ATP-dependent Clp protease ATP-binding subunit ClpA
MGGIVAGTMLRGMFEERIKGIIDEVKETRQSYPVHR